MSLLTHSHLILCPHACTHQVVDDGVEMIECSEAGGEPCQLYTVFSAAAYPAGLGSNCGAVLRLSTGAEPTVLLFGGDFSEDAAERRDRHARSSLSALINAHKGRLREAFERRVCERGGGSRLAVNEWVGAMSEVLTLELDWATLQPAIAPTIKRAAVGGGMRDTGLVDFERFLQSSVLSPADARSTAGVGAEDLNVLHESMGALKAVLEMLDTDRNGSVSRDEFVGGVAMLNERLPEEQRLGADLHALFDQIDVDGSNELSFAELVDAFRALPRRSRK